jgi:4-amino-4-deoxy-L-arabinose transferase-like glycosyltransferase
MGGILPASSNRRLLISAIRWLFVFGMAAYAIVFVFNSLTRYWYFSNDSMNYVDVARNISAGRGIVQSTLGFNQPYLFEETSPIPSPMTSQSPLYPILIALLSLFGIPHAEAALSISGFVLGGVILMAYLLGRDLYNEATGWLAAGLLLLYAPLGNVARVAWTESPAIFLVLLSFWLLARLHRVQRSRKAWIYALLAGFAAGLAFATRYSMIPIFFVGCGFILIAMRFKRESLMPLLFFILAFSLPFLGVAAHNYISIGRIMPPALPSQTDWVTNVKDLLRYLFGLYLAEEIDSTVQLIVMGALLLVIGIAWLIRGGVRSSLQELFVQHGGFLVPLWILAYSSFLVYRRTVTNFDEINPRLVSPAVVAFMILVAALAASLLSKRGENFARYGVLLLVLVACVWEIHTSIVTPPLNVVAEGHQSERMIWIETKTTARDLIIGDNTVDIPFYLHRPAAISFSPYPYTVYLTYKKLSAFVARHCADYDRFYIVLRKKGGTERGLKRQYGSFVRDLLLGNAERYPDVIKIKDLPETLIYQITTCPGH